MKYCSKCGQQVHDEAVVCVHCGCSVSQSAQAKPVDESVSYGLVVLAAMIPLFGLIYWPVKAKERPNCARACGIAALVAWAAAFIFLMAAASV